MYVKNNLYDRFNLEIILRKQGILRRLLQRYVLELVELLSIKDNLYSEQFYTPSNINFMKRIESNLH